jgi:tetratricopeptide (TPR) repeat protein
VTGVGGPAQRSARVELDSARGVVARLDTHRGSEDLAADLIEIWTSMEASLRSLVGTTALAGQTLIREARLRQLINFDQANAIAEFQAVRDRLQDVSYRPNESDVNAARNAFLKLDAALSTQPSATMPPAAASTVKAPAVTEISEPVKVIGPPRRVPIWAMAGGGVALVAIVLLLVLRPFGGGTSVLEQGTAAYRSGQREVAVSYFTRAAKEPKTAVLAHVYLARMAREVGNFTLASQELQLALQADPSNATALREMGANLLAQGNYELARRFYVRAVQADPTDKTSLGYLGCTLMRLNRIPEGTAFVNRAGPGPWSNCTPATTQNQAGQLAPPGSIPR